MKITEEILKKMIKLRKQGATYKKIMQILGVSKWACINYLKGIEVEKSAVEKAWRKAELEAQEFLREQGFTEIHDLNRICPSPYWDLLAKKGDGWWLIDVTISEGKSIGAKIPRVVSGYTHAILYRDLNGNKWKLVKITFEDVEK